MRQHILKHGDIRKKTTIVIGGEEKEVSMRVYAPKLLLQAHHHFVCFLFHFLSGRRPSSAAIACVSFQIDTYVEEEDEDTIKHSTAPLANRQSFVAMRDQMKARGEEVRASLEEDSGVCGCKYPFQVKDAGGVLRTTAGCGGVGTLAGCRCPLCEGLVACSRQQGAAMKCIGSWPVPHSRCFLGVTAI